MSRNRILALSVFLLLVLSGFVQERWKIAINFCLDYGDRIPGYFEMSPEEKREAFTTLKDSLQRPHDYYYSHETPALLYRFDRPPLTALKWGLAAVLLMYAALLNALFIRLWFSTVLYVKWLFSLYGVALAFAFTGNAMLRMAGSPEMAYLFSREILGALQSALPSMLMLPGIWLYRHSSAQSS